MLDPSQEAMVQELLGRIADKWTLLVIEVLDRETEIRFSRLQERVGGISQKMLTKTLRNLERDGLVTRHVHPTIPPHRVRHVDVACTARGRGRGGSPQLRCPQPAAGSVAPRTGTLMSKADHRNDFGFAAPRDAPIPYLQRIKT
jgi:DNA-binding HxlR family transcriptional regulator